MDLRVRVTDYIWLVVAGLAVVAVIWLVLPVAVGLVSQPSPGRFLAFLIGTPIIVVVGRWVAAGAWRRTAWGAPPGGLREAREHSG